MIESELAGAELAAALAAGVAGIEQLELSESSRGRLVDLALAAERVKAWAAAVQAAATVALVEQFETAHEAVCARDREVAHERAVEATALSLSLALGVSMRAADHKLVLALGLAEHTPLAQALAAGRVDEAQARVINDHTAGLSPGHAARLVASVVTDPADPANSAAARAGVLRELRDGTRTVWSIPAHQLRPILTRAVAELAPEDLEAAAEVAERGRHVAHYASTPQRPGALVLHGPDHLLAAMYTHLDHAARAARTAGAPQSLDQLRFDLAAGHLTDGAYGLSITRKGTSKPNRRRTTLVNLTSAETTMLGLDNTPAVLHTPSGDVPIPAELARALAHDPEHATWRRILCDPATGTATEVSPSYRPNTRIAELCRVRDGHTSRFPTSAARTIELDHIDEYDHRQPTAGGATTPANLAAAGKRDHQAKTDRILDVTGNANGTLTYTTGTGHTYTSRPHQYLDPQPLKDQPPDNGDPPY
jgi:hypothetical protein